ncbi:MAG: M14 family metallopeptidase [bacterium]
MNFRRRRTLICLTISFHLILGVCYLQAQNVPSPASHFRFELGTDGKLASWKSIVEYYYKLADASDRVTVRNLGKTTLGNPFLLVIITAPENQARLDRLAEISRSLADLRGLSEAEIEQLIADGKSVVAVTVGLHSTEVAATQMAPGLAYRLATSNDPQTSRILHESVLLLFGCFNPDGTEMVVEWVDKTRGTKYQGSRLPDLYHHYAGHDNNRDSYMLSLNESQMFAQVVYHEWIPQMYLDVHQMGSYGARLYVPPYHDPINPNVDPLIWMEHELVGANMEIALERAGIKGVVAGAPYTGWWFPSFHMSTNHRNIAGMLTETASARLAWPLYIHPHQLRPHGRSHSEYEPMQIFPNPWPGGWWRLADMIKQQEISTYSLLVTAANNRELLLQNRVFKARRTIKRGKEGPVFAYIIPAGQHDPLTIEKFIGVLMNNNIEVHRATSDFIQDGRAYTTGDFVVSLAQPNGVLAKSLLAEAHYPDNAITRRADGSILRPYDMANFVLAEHMDVQAQPAYNQLNVSLERLTETPKSQGSVKGSGSAGWILSHQYNDAFRAMNEILAQGSDIFWLKQPIELEGKKYAPGAIWIPGGRTSASQISDLTQKYGLPFQAVSQPPKGTVLKLKKLRFGLYRRYMGGNIDEGWTRYLLDTWDFPYERVNIDAIHKDALKNLDVLLIPHDNMRALMGGVTKEKKDEGVEEEYPDVFLPPAYKKSFDDKGLKKLKDFIRQGGTLILLGGASQFALEKLGVPIRNVVQDLPDTEYFCPGSTLRAQFDTSHPLAYGMPKNGLILNWSNPTFAINPSSLNEQIAAPVTYPKQNLLKSGWLIGEEKIAGKAAALDIDYGKGRIILIGFRPQHRSQTHGTFKIIFNAIYYGAAEEVFL